MALMKDVARQAGVSVSTVSFVLNGTAKQHKVSDATAARVVKAAKELGYRINTASSSAAQPRQKVIAFYFPEGGNPSDLGMLMANAYQYLALQQIRCNLMAVSYPSKGLCQTVRNSDWSAIDAAVVIVVQGGETRELEALAPRRPLVIFNEPSRQYHSVVCSPEASFRKLCDIIRLRDLRRVEVVASHSSPYLFDRYFPAFLDCCRESGISIPADQELSVENSFYGGAIAARQILNAPRRPTLILTMNTVLARGAIPVFARGEFYIPRHAALASFGLDSDRQYLQNHIPSLTMIMFPSQEMSKLAVDLALQAMEEPKREPVHRICQCELIVNESLPV